MENVPVLDRMDSEIKELQEIVGEGFVDENGDRITITDMVNEMMLKRKRIC